MIFFLNLGLCKVSSIIMSLFAEIKRVPLEKLCLRIKILGIFFGCDVKVR